MYEKEKNPKENTVMRKLLRIYWHIHHKTGRVSTVNILEIALFCESCQKNTGVKDEAALLLELYLILVLRHSFPFFQELFMSAYDSVFICCWGLVFGNIWVENTC